MDKSDETFEKYIFRERKEREKPKNLQINEKSAILLSSSNPTMLPFPLGPSWAGSADGHGLAEKDAGGGEDTESSPLLNDEGFFDSSSDVHVPFS